MAVLSAKLYVTVTPPSIAPFKVTVKSAVPASSLTVTSFTVRVELSPSVMVPVPVSLSSTFVFEPDRVTVKVSSVSVIASSVVLTVNCRVSPAVPVKLTVCVAFEKSVPPVAVTSVKLISTSNPPSTSLSKVIVNCRLLPSVAVTSSTAIEAASLSVIVPVPVSLSSTRLLSELRLTIYSSDPSTIASSVVVTVN